MCFGVRDAIAKAERLASERPLTILGELVHNPVVRERLRAAGVEEDRTGSSVAAGARAMITAHGASDRRHAALQASGVIASDATCPLVRRAHQQLKALVAAGYFPVVIGKRGHVEVIGLTEDFPVAAVVESLADIGSLPPQSKYGVISQTTQPLDRVREIVAAIKQSHADAEVRFVDTVCQPTKDRQRALRSVLAVADTVVVVGGRNSNNTLQLVAACHAAGRRAVHVERAEELSAASFADAQIVGVTAGTSTLPDTVASVVARLEQFARIAPPNQQQKTPAS